MPRITHRVFTDLAIFMIGLGLLAGVIFPPFVVVLGMPAANAFTPLFAAACLAAGLCVGALNWVLARRVVGRRLELLTSRMNEVSLEVEKASQADEWWHADPARWRIGVDSEDILGATAGAFDRLVEVLARSLRYQKAGHAFAEIMVSESSVEELSRAALDCLLLEAGAEAGAIVTVDSAGRYVRAFRGVAGPEPVLQCDLLVDALGSGRPAGRIGHCDVALASGRQPVDEIYVTPFLYGGEVRGAMLLAATKPVGAYARSVAELFARDFGVAIANLSARELVSTAAAARPRP